MQPLTIVGETDHTGTEVTFLADDQIFDSVVYEFETLRERLQEMAFLTKGLRISLTDLREGQEQERTFHYEGGIRVPMIVAWPGHVKPGAETDFPCSFWDLMPTFRELTGAAPVEGMDGVSLLPLLTGKKGQREHDYLYFEFQELGGRQAVREGPWKLVHLDIRNEHPRYELYNLDADPGEENDLAAMEPGIVEHLKGLMREAHVPNPDFPVLPGE